MNCQRPGEIVEYPKEFRLRNKFGCHPLQQKIKFTEDQHLTLSTISLFELNDKFRFILYSEEDKTEIERIYSADFQLELDANSYVEMEN